MPMASNILSHVSAGRDIQVTQHNYYIREEMALDEVCQQLQKVNFPEVNEKELQYYIPAWGRLKNRNKQKLFEDISQGFLGNEQKVLALFGSAGEGKSTFFQYLTKQLQAVYRNTDTIVLYLQLADFEDPLHDLIETAFKRLGLSQLQINKLKSSKKFIFIIDGRDENNTGLYQNLYLTNKLHLWHAKILISCRSTYKINVADYVRLFYPIVDGKVDPKGLCEVDVELFDDDQITDYITRFVNDPPEGVIVANDVKDPQKIISRIKSIPGIFELIRNPFLLRILMEVLPKVESNYQKAVSKSKDPVRFTQREIIDAFVENLWERQAYKLMQKGDLPEDGHGITLDFEEYCHELAKAMKFNPGGALTQVIYKKGMQPWEKFFGNSDKNMVRAREGCPLKFVERVSQNTKIISFLHPILIDYFVSRVPNPDADCHQDIDMDQIAVNEAAPSNRDYSLRP